MAEDIQFNMPTIVQTYNKGRRVIGTLLDSPSSLYNKKENIIYAALFADQLILDQIS